MIPREYSLVTFGLVVFFIALSGCASERQVDDGSINRFGEAANVEITCENTTGKVVFERKVDNWGGNGSDRSNLTHSGRCIQVAHPKGNIRLCGYACSVVPLK
tara:strand:+ start:1582 stop:1890 length:309 start_codon:yes stop_codon:yes gene_type:complete